MHDTYGFPVDLTKCIAGEQGLNIDETEVSVAQERAREASKGEKRSIPNLVQFDVHDIATLDSIEDLSRIDNTAKYSKGTISATVRAVSRDKKFLQNTSEVPQGLQFGVLLDKTNMYAESSRQECGTRKLLIAGGTEMEVRSVYSYGGYVLHSSYIKDRSISVGDKVLVKYTKLRRQSIRVNHTKTHILNHTLREVLGAEIEQKGSLITPQKLRFNVTHKAAVTDEELDNIEKISAKYIQEDMEVFTSEVKLSTARQTRGVRFIPDETYPDPVRVISIGVPIENLLLDVASKDWGKYSIEFCGGTHVDRTSEV